jgi:uncharacterized surface protein with fasciclin (FAS1) repeats
VDSAAAAVGVYRPVLPTDTMRPPGIPADTLARDTIPGDTLRPDTLPPGASPGDTLRRDTLPADTLAARTGADSLADTAVAAGARGLVPADTGVADTSRKQNALQPAEPETDDTSLTARMDASRGGGLRRQDFPDLLNTAKLTGSYRTFIGLMERSSLRRLLTGGTEVTILAPTDSAFAKLPAADLTRLRDNASARDAWLGTLIFNGNLRSADLLKAGGVRSRGGNLIHFSSADSAVRAGQARLVQPDLVARNGILHGVDRVNLTNPASATP